MLKLIFLFLCLHEIGAHYTYSGVPYDAWFQALTGGSLNAWMGWEPWLRQGRRVPRTFAIPRSTLNDALARAGWSGHGA